jgi:uncharacterized protein YbgA (DUF1722 family)/uncharacterized protein YbbK (DUF523 family)
VSEFARPRVVVSRCLEFAPCRWNGQVIADETVRRLMGHVTFCPVCPEMEVGLGVPRDPVRVCRAGGRLRLYQPATGRDVTEAMERFAADFLGALGPVDGAILKGRSPSCGMKDVKVYAGTGAEAMAAEKGAGFFGGAVLGRLGHLAVEDEGRLQNFVLRDHFLTKLFAGAALREARQAGGAAALVEFHTRHKWLLMAYHEGAMRLLGRIVANHERRPLADVWADYAAHLARALARPARYRANINVLMHALGFVGEGLSAAEKAEFLDTVERYRRAKAPLSVPLAVLKSWAVRFGRRGFLEQAFLAPYPEALVDLADSGKGRDR